MTSASNSAKDHHNKFRKAIHNLKCSCTTYSMFFSSEQVCKHLMIVNSPSEEKTQPYLDSLLGQFCLLIAVFTFHVFNGSVILLPASFPVSWPVCLEDQLCAAAFTSLCGKKVICFLYAIYRELLHSDGVSSPQQL